MFMYILKTTNYSKQADTHVLFNHLGFVAMHRYLLVISEQTKYIIMYSNCIQNDTEDEK